MHRPAHVTARIKEHKRMALAGVRGRQPEKALLGFYASMEHLCSVAGPLLLDHISLSAIITATAQLWTSAQANSSFKPSANTAGIEMRRFYCSVLVWLHPKLLDVGAQAVSNILWSSAKLGLNPDAFVPGMTDALAAKLLQLAKDEARHQPNAQDCANFLWALATLGHEPADKGLVDAVCAHFVRLIRHYDDSKQPNAQEGANFMWALAALGHGPSDKGLADVVCNHFARLIRHHDDSKQPNAQDCANFLWAFVSLGHYPADRGLVDAVFHHLVMLIRHRDARKRPIAQHVSNVMWALGKMNHAPPDGAASAILEWFTRLCKLPGQEPNAQELSNTLFAIAVLRLKVKGHVSIALINGLLRLDRSSGYRQDYCNAAWSLAVSGTLSSEIFGALLDRLRSLPTAQAVHDALPTPEMAQLYQALDSLQPLPSVAAQQLQDMLGSLGQRPLPDRKQDADSSFSRQLSLALGQLGLAFTPDVPLSGYWVNAVLHPRDGVTDPIVMATEFLHCFKNKNHRCVRYHCASNLLHSIYGCSCFGCMPPHS